MKLLYISCCFILLSLLSCEVKPAKHHVHVHNSSFHPSRHLATQGGGREIPIDTISTIEQLIGQLESKWDLIETGKAYWIGYTPLMFSIAERKDSAIQPLLNFVDTCKNEHANYGAIYTLHLIGINSEIKGRFYEEFSNQTARRALLALLKYPEYQPIIICLLNRDRHVSDIPFLFETLVKCDSDCWALNNYLTYFSLPLPVNQHLQVESFRDVIEKDYTEALKKNYQNQLLPIIAKISKSNFPDILVDSTLLRSNLSGSMSVGYYFRYDLPFGKVTINIVDFLNTITTENYYNIGSRVQYYVENKKLHICTQTTAKARLIDWWLCMSPEERKMACEQKKK